MCIRDRDNAGNVTEAEQESYADAQSYAESHNLCLLYTSSDFIYTYSQKMDEIQKTSQRVRQKPKPQMNKRQGR